MKRLLTIIAIAAASAAGAGQPTGAQSLDELLNQVRSARTEAAQRNKAREAEFLRARDQQRALVNQTRAELQTEEATLAGVDRGQRGRAGDIGPRTN